MREAVMISPVSHECEQDADIVETVIDEAMIDSGDGLLRPVCGETLSIFQKRIFLSFENSEVVWLES